MKQFACPEELEPGYYSIRDPHDGSVTHWCRPEKQAILKAWPTKANPGPKLYAKDVPKGEGRIPFMREWNDTVAIPYAQAVHAAIMTDPVQAGARFAAWCTRCCLCGKTLTDPASKCYGVGPECRRIFDDEDLEWLANAMSRALAEREDAA
ncbi:DUF6011 domain-containing protein [Rhodococcus sp. PSBB049]|uniref:DUF6011 domain-containing protein n=1 Tax=Rhodococcus sp. PSBB049 TaxID=2812863 RepID=UPI00197F149D|nr:DUF6011 domain-containing protein [Rhodococcus sp. PSBB049]QSE72198.1 hypothetical protein JYA91_27895 [Rhodococcus sp. PSBB049]